MSTIIGSGNAETLNGTLGDDLIKAKGGADTVFGGEGNDDIRAGGGADVVFGGAGWDTIKGGGGHDIIHDGAGIDSMWGGNGKDTFVLEADGFGDTIRDWESRDTIDLSDLGVTGLDQIRFEEVNGIVKIFTENDGTLNIYGKNDAALSAADFTADKFVFAQPVLETIDFEDLSQPYSYGDVLNRSNADYADLSWSNQVWFLEKDKVGMANFQTGLQNSDANQNVVLSNLGGFDVDFSSDWNFDFEEITVGSLFHDGMTLRVIGMDDGLYVGEQLVTVGTGSATTVQMDDMVFDSVDQIVFQTYGGTYNPDLPMYGAPDTTNFYLEEMVWA